MKRTWWVALGLTALGLWACAGVGGPAIGPADDHCDGMDAGVVDPAACADTPPPTDGGIVYGATNYGTEADDDDCKYHVSWTSNTIAKNSSVTFTVTLKALVDGSLVSGAQPIIEAFLSDTHPAANVGTVFSEITPGVYTVGPVDYDASGRWTTRFHFFENCADEPQSPHGHAAFFIDVP